MRESQSQPCNGSPVIAPRSRWNACRWSIVRKTLPADLDAIRDATADLNPAGIITLEMAKVTQRMLAVSIPEVASLDAARTFTNEFVAGQ